MAEVQYYKLNPFPGTCHGKTGEREKRWIKRELDQIYNRLAVSVCYKVVQESIVISSVVDY